MKKSTILVKNTTRQLLKEIGTKGQTYDQLINELVKTKRSKQNSSDRRFETPQSDESVNP